MDARQMTIQQLQEAGIRLSEPRIAILAYIRKVKSHPSAETVYAALQKKYPALSLTTVYNTLRLFAEKGLVLQLDVDAVMTRFDGCTAPHGHFRCRACGKIYDIDEPRLKEMPSPEGFFVETMTLCFTGLCPECAARRPNDCRKVCIQDSSKRANCEAK